MPFALRVAMLAALFVSSCEPAFAEDRSAWFKSLKQPGSGASCCDIADCRQTKAAWREGQWWADVYGAVRAVPPDKVLQRPYSIDGEAYVCADDNKFIKPESRTIYCFIPPTMGF